MLAEAMCLIVGFGAYPTILEPKCGHGPSKNIPQEMLDHPLDLEYDFETIESFNPIIVEKCSTFREATMHWNKCIQYWLAINIYKRFPSKKFRMAATMGVSAFWHGINGGDYLMMMGPTLYVPLEKLFMQVVKSQNVSEWQQNIINVVLCALKVFAFSYMGICFWLQDFDKVWLYYSSVYHFGYVLWAGIYIACLVILGRTKSVIRKETKRREYLFAPSSQFEIEKSI